MAKRKRRQTTKRKRASEQREGAGSDASPDASAAEGPPEGDLAEPAPAVQKAPAAPEPTARKPKSKPSRRGAAPRAQKKPRGAKTTAARADTGAASTASSDAEVEAEADTEAAAPPERPTAGPGARLADLVHALTAETTRRRGLEERLRDLLGRRDDEVERAAEAALLRTQARAEAALERSRDKGGAEVEALRRELRLTRARLEADLGEAQAHFLRLRAEVEERVAKARTDAEAQTRRSLERVLDRTERRGEIERKQLTAEIDRLRAALEAVGGATGASPILAPLPAPPPPEPAPCSAPPPPPAADRGADEHAARLADAEERMRRAVLDAERTALEATEELDRVEERLRANVVTSQSEVSRLKSDLEEARIEARVAQMLGEALKASRAEVGRLKEQTKEIAAQAVEAGGGGPLTGPSAGGGSSLPPRRGATGTRLMAVPSAEIAGPPIPPPPPRRKRGTSTQIIEVGKAAVWHDNAKRMVQVSIGGERSSTPRSKVGRMQRAITASDLDSDPTIATPTPEDEPSSEPDTHAEDAAATEPSEVATVAVEGSAPVDFDPDEWDDV